MPISGKGRLLIATMLLALLLLPFAFSETSGFASGSVGAVYTINQGLNSETR